MSDKAFLDTNVIIYFFSENEADKRKTAHSLLNNHDCISSTQAMNEAANVWFKKCGWSGEKIREH